MAKITGPLFSMEAHGNIGGAIQFRGNRYGSHAYRPPRPEQQNQQPPTPAQAAVRGRYAEIRALWSESTEPERQTWRDLANLPGYAGTGWNLFLATHMATTDATTCDGGTPWAIPTGTIDGGTPSSHHDRIFDGGAP